jgi:4-hydroxy-4-methyl-2-oxoglutarate aldolase
MTDVAAALRRHGTATVFEAAGGCACCLDRIRPLWPGAEIAGPACVVEAPPGDNLAVHRALVDCAAGAVLVVATGSETRTAIFGEVLAVAAACRGCVGLVTDGAVRDGEQIRQLRFPVFCAGTTPAGAAKLMPGRLGVRAVVAGVEVSPGDWLVGDADGVIVLKVADIEAVLARAQDRARREAALIERIRAGETTLDLLGLWPEEARP